MGVYVQYHFLPGWSYYLESQLVYWPHGIDENNP